MSFTIPMMSEWFWLLLVGILGGWYLSYILKQRRQKKSLTISKSYIKQLNTILNKRHDKAVDTFIDLFDVSDDTIETHIMFGNLFRQRGEIEKAVRIHQNVINKSSIKNYYCTEAMLELARDYFDAGLYDRTEKLLQEALILKTVPIQLEVCHQLARLYEIEKNWSRAIAVVKKLQKLTSSDIDSHCIAHYYCELAQEAIKLGNYYNAEKHIGKAKRYSEDLLRIDILLGDIALKKRNFSQAREYYGQSLSGYPEFSQFILPKIFQTLDNSKSACLDYLRQLKMPKPDDNYINIYVKLLVDNQCQEELEEFITALTDNKTLSLETIPNLLQYHLDSNNSGQRKFMEKIICLLENTLLKTPLYQCSNCGFHSNRLYWQCPSCRHWDTTAPSLSTHPTDDSGLVSHHISARR